jgi:3-hydroxyanthranilate 3,4-dioxygenase
VGNKMIWQDSEFMVMAVGGPKQRKDFSRQDGEEFFFQVEGHHPPHHRERRGAGRFPSGRARCSSPARHSPFASAAGQYRRAGDRAPPGRRRKDHLRWFCEECGEVLYDANFQLVDLGKQLKPIIEQFWADESLRTCRKCGHVMAPRPGRASR